MANQSIVYVLDANGIKQPIACSPLTWDGIANVNMQSIMPIPWNYATVNVSGVTVIKNSPGILGAVINTDPFNTQNYEIQAYDNASVNSGPKVMDIGSLANKSRYDWQPGGVAMQNGIVIYCAGNPTGLIVLWL